jgi:rod shape-determining protein MreB
VLGLLRPHRLYLRFSDRSSCLQDVTSGAESVLEPVVGLVERGGLEQVVSIGAASAPGAGVRLVRPFSHPRLVIAEFEAAQALLGHQLQQVRSSRVIVRPEIVLHALRTFAEPLTDVEQRALIELAHSVGAWRAMVHSGSELGRAEVLSLSFEGSARARRTTRQWS